MTFSQLNDSTKLMSPAQVASLFSVSPITVRSWADKGLLKYIRTPGGHRRYRYQDVQALFEKTQH